MRSILGATHVARLTDACTRRAFLSPNQQSAETVSRYFPPGSAGGLLARSDMVLSHVSREIAPTPLSRQLARGRRLPVTTQRSLSCELAWSVGASAVVGVVSHALHSESAIQPKASEIRLDKVFMASSTFVGKKLSIGIRAEPPRSHGQCDESRVNFLCGNSK